MTTEPNTLPIGTPELVDLLGQFIPTEPIAIPTGAPEHFDAALVAFQGQCILNLNEVIRRQQALIEDLEQRLAAPCVVTA